MRIVPLPLSHTVDRVQRNPLTMCLLIHIPKPTIHQADTEINHTPFGPCLPLFFELMVYYCLLKKNSWNATLLIGETCDYILFTVNNFIVCTCYCSTFLDLFVLSLIKCKNKLKLQFLKQSRREIH